MRKSKGWMEPDETRSSCIAGSRLPLLLLRRYPNSTPAASSSPDCPPWPILTGGNPQASRFPPKPHRHAQHLRTLLILQPQRHQPPRRRGTSRCCLLSHLLTQLHPGFLPAQAPPEGISRTIAAAPGRQLDVARPPTLRQRPLLAPTGAGLQWQEEDAPGHRVPCLDGLDGQPTRCPRDGSESAADQRCLT